MDITSFLVDLRAYGLANDVPNISDENAKFLQNLIRISGARDVLELGTANGLSTIHLALALRETGGHITSIEHSPPAHTEALKNLQDAGVDDMATLILGSALDELSKFSPDSFDFIFIDAHKKRTVDFFKQSYPLLRPGGFIVVDDVIKFRYKMEDFYEYLAQSGIEYTLLPIDPDDGIMFIVKPKKTPI